jgi:multidrug efflux pump subunit AcrB
LRQIPGVYGIEDDMPYGREQVVFNLTPAGEALGLTLDELSSQLRAALDGKLVQLFQDGPEEVEVRVRLPERGAGQPGPAGRMTIRAPQRGLGAPSHRRPLDHAPGLRGPAPRGKPVGGGGELPR